MNQQKLLIGIMSYHDNDLPFALKSLANQPVDFDWFHIENQENKLANQMLYAVFAAQKDQYLAFIRLDGDMVLYDNILPQYQKIYQKNPKIGAIKAQLFDFLTDKRIPGIYSFRSNCQFIDHNDPLIPDIDPIINGATHFIYEPVGDHMAHSSPYQAYRYGLQRGKKILQSDRVTKDLTAQLIEWTIIVNLINARSNKPHPLRDMALMGFHDIMFADEKYYQEIFIENYAGTISMRRSADLLNMDSAIIAQALDVMCHNTAIIASQIAQKSLNSVFSNFQRAPAAFDLQKLALPTIFNKSQLENKLQ